MKLDKLCIAVLWLAASSAAFAQSTYGTIDGTITDPSSAVIRGAKVEAVNEQTKVAHTLDSDANGLYRFLNLDPGVYTISATAAGFSRTEQKDIHLQAREELPVNFQLALASAAGATVEVVGTPVIAEGQTLSDSKSGDDINSLALNFRATASPLARLAWPHWRLAFNPIAAGTSPSRASCRRRPPSLWTASRRNFRATADPHAICFRLSRALPNFA